MFMTSGYYLVFAGSIVVLLWLSSPRLRWLVLLAASLFFYSHAAGTSVLLLLLVNIFIIYAVSLLVGRTRPRRESVGEIADSRAAVAGNVAYLFTLILQIGILASVKYGNFLIDNAISLFPSSGIVHTLPRPGFVLPLGISFYTFQLLGYLIDVSRGTIQPEKNPGKLALFALFFPSITLGPINRFNHLAPQLSAGAAPQYRQVSFGMQRIVYGFFKKLVVAENIKPIVDSVFDNPALFSWFFLILAVMLFAMQLYSEFSGCIDIAIGTAQCYGIELPENFRSPFFSCSVAEFWRRWHITLGSWFRDYVYYPLSMAGLLALKKRVSMKTAKRISTYGSLFILWFLLGLWHGADWSFVIGTGLIYWVYMTVGDICRPFFVRAAAALHIDTATPSWRFFQRLRTFLLFCLGLTFFRSPDVMYAFRYLGRIMRLEHGSNRFEIYSLADFNTSWPEILLLTVSISILFILSLIKQNHSIRELLASQNIVFRWALYYILIISVLIFGVYGPGYNISDFIYGAF